MLILSDWVTTYYPSQESWTAILQRQDRSKRALLPLGYGSLQTTQNVNSKDNKTTFDFTVQVTGTTPVPKPDIDALDYVVVKFYKDFTIGSRTFHDGEVAKIPAMLCYMIMNDMKNSTFITAGKYTAYAIGAAIGVSEIMAATTAVEMTLAILDVGILTTDFVVNEALATRLSQTPEGRRWLDNFNKFALVYGGTRAVAELTGLARELRNSASIVNDQEVIDASTNATAKVITASGILNDAFLPGWDAVRVLKYTKGARPQPNVYLKSQYIEQHLAKFDEGAVRFTSRSSLTSYGTLGPDGGFVLPKKEFDSILQETGGNLAAIERKLGFDTGYLASDDLLIAIIEKDDIVNLRLASGNEGGANKFWIPGGYTSGDVSEAIMDFSGKPKFSEITIK